MTKEALSQRYPLRNRNSNIPRIIDDKKSEILQSPKLQSSVPRSPQPIMSAMNPPSHPRRQRLSSRNRRTPIYWCGCYEENNASCSSAAYSATNLTSNINYRRLTRSRGQVIDMDMSYTERLFQNLSTWKPKAVKVTKVTMPSAVQIPAMENSPSHPTEAQTEPDSKKSEEHAFVAEVEVMMDDELGFGEFGLHQSMDECFEITVYSTTDDTITLDQTLRYAGIQNSEFADIYGKLMNDFHRLMDSAFDGELKSLDSYLLDTSFD